MQIPPLAVMDCTLVFKHLVQKYKISKLHDCNYKILYKILATPAIIAGIRKQPSLQDCIWCGQRANINHILVHCPETQKIQDDFIIKLGEVSDCEWILGQKDMEICQITSVLNFGIYKDYLMAT